jgi:hypothetical protein
MYQSTILFGLCLFALSYMKGTAAWITSLPSNVLPSRQTSSLLNRNPAATVLKMAMDYNDPIVAEEFANVQPMDFDDVEAELREKGIPVPPTMKYVIS